MANLQAWWTNFSAYMATLTTQEGKINSWQYLAMLLGAAVVLLLLLLILYIMKSGQMHRERKVKERISTLISHLCDIYTQVEEVDFDKGEATVYSMKDGAVEVTHVPAKKLEELIAEFHPDDAEKYTPNALKVIIERAMKTCSQEELIVREANSDGTYQWMSYLFQGVHRDNQHHRNCLFLKHSVDDVKRKELEQQEQVKKALSIAKDAAESKGRFMVNLSKEIRTILDSIAGYLGLATIEEDHQKQQEYVKQSKEQTTHLLRLVKNVVDITSLENGNIELDNTLFDFENNLHSLSEMFVKEAKQKNIGFDMQLKDLKVPYVQGDKLRLNQILINILSNAFKFTEPGGQVNCLVRQKGLKNKKVYMEFAISDTGKGIPKEYLERVFMPFEPGKQENGATGSGLGLAITYNLVHMMGGVISVTSQEGQGTKFVLEVPFGYTEEKNRNMEEIQVFPFVKALVVDDQENSCKYLEALLKKFNVETAIVTSGSAALSALNEANIKGKPFNLCLLDWKMPGMNGLELAKKIKEMNFKKLKVAMASGHDLSVIRNEGEAVGLCAMLEKPLFAANIFSLLMENFEEEANDLKEQTHHYDFKSARVLVAEDNDINAELIVKLLEKANCKVERVTNGQEACEKFGTTKAGFYQAIFLDVDMPEIDGCETAKLIRMSDHPEGPTIPLIAMTDHALSEDVAKALGAGMNSFVEKPLVAEKLYSALQNFME